MKARNLQLFTAQLRLFDYLSTIIAFIVQCSTIIATISITFPDSTKYQMTRYDVTVSNFLWIADCCIMRTFSTRIIRIFCFVFEKYVRICTYFILSYAYPRTLVL